MSKPDQDCGNCLFCKRLSFKISNISLLDEIYRVGCDDWKEVLNNVRRLERSAGLAVCSMRVHNSVEPGCEETDPEIDCEKYRPSPFMIRPENDTRSGLVTCFLMECIGADPRSEILPGRNLVESVEQIEYEMRLKEMIEL